MSTRASIRAPQLLPNGTLSPAPRGGGAQLCGRKLLTRPGVIGCSCPQRLRTSHVSPGVGRLALVPALGTTPVGRTRTGTWGVADFWPPTSPGVADGPGL